MKLGVLAASLFLSAPFLGATSVTGVRPKVKKVMEIKSSAFENGEAIPKQYTGEGEDISPPLKISTVPKKTESFVLIMDDPDAPAGTWVHWLIYDLPPDTRNLHEGIPRREFFKDGVKQGLCWGVDSFDRFGYYGPLPPPGKLHHYFFKLYALDKMLKLPAKATKAELLQAIKGHSLASAELVGTYQR